MSHALYPASFYESRREHTRHAADRILNALPRRMRRRSVADIGCGTGTWLAAALANGAGRAIGFEGDWVRPDMLDDARIEFTAVDLEQPLAGPAVDLVLSLEVAEHLSEERAPSFVANLAAMGPAVLFSAAVPGQGGVGHRNEQWQSWWAHLFAAHELLAFDIIRPQIWSDEQIPAWYRQNVVLYLRQDVGRQLSLTPTAPQLLDKVHPAFWERANRELRCAGALPESEVLRRQSDQKQR